MASPDSDGDGLVDATEEWLGTDPDVQDTDGDGLVDGSEVFEHGTEPLNPDTDGDLLPDGWEVAGSLDPNDGTGDNGGGGDPDLDGFLNRDEYGADTHPQNAASLLQVIGALPSPSGTFVTWIGGVDATQVVESIDVLAPTGMPWAGFATNLPPTAITNSVLDPEPAVPIRHYRIRARR